jgi:hypothetical protein
MASTAFKPVCIGSMHGLPFSDARRDDFDRASLAAIDRPFSVERIAERVDHAADHCVADRDGQQSSERADFVPLGDFQIIAQDDHADAVFFQVKRQPDDSAGELNHFARSDIRQAVDSGDTVAHFQDHADFSNVDLALVLCNF